MRTSSGLGSSTSVGFFLHLGQLLSTCVPCLLVASMDTRSECTVNWSVFPWCFCFSATLTVFMVELCVLQSHFPLICYDLLYHYAFYFTLCCLVIFAINYVQLLLQGPTWNQAITATAFSFVSSVLYATKVAWTCALTGDTFCFVPTGPGVLGSLLIFLVCVILAFTYSILINCDTCFQYTSAMRETVLSILLYTSSLVLWPFYPFEEKLGGQPLRSSDCAVCICGMC
ncbi:myeloid-associated differentiation marker-like [Odocoileus virginianus]|uniref:Myeloid-associated differentiation marker-like n=1 Tax=Odocoileus virginianus TaxID=9874 RepID=A0ABM4J0P2_ODOVR